MQSDVVEFEPRSSGAEICEILGRQAELATLQDALHAALDGSGRLLVASGEPGIGKTRLALELERMAEKLGFVVAWARGWQSGGAPAFWTWS